MALLYYYIAYQNYTNLSKTMEKVCNSLPARSFAYLHSCFIKLRIAAYITIQGIFINEMLSLFEGPKHHCTTTFKFTTPISYQQKQMSLNFFYSLRLRIDFSSLLIIDTWLRRTNFFFKIFSHKAKVSLLQCNRIWKKLKAEVWSRISRK